MQTNFYVTENRLLELKSFIRKELPTARFKHNPLKQGDEYFISLTMEVQDGNKLNELHNKWHEEYKPSVIHKKTIWKRFLSALKGYF